MNKKTELRRLAILTVFVLLAASCTSAPKTTGADELDLTLRETAAYYSMNIPAGDKLAIVAVRSDYPALSEYIIDSLAEQLVNGRLFTVVERQQLDLIRAELNFNMSGEVDDNSAQAIGRMLGAQTIITGSVSSLGTMWRLSTRALTVERAELQGLYNSNIPNRGIITALTSGPKTAAVVDSAGGTRAAVPALANGTYTLNPRPRGRLDGVWQDIYVSRVEVDSEYITVFFENRESTGDGYGRSGRVNWDRDYATLSNLDNQAVYQRNTGNTGQGGGYVVSVVFPRISGARFKLENRQRIIFAEITLGEPDRP